MASDHLDKVVEVYKARLTVGLALLLAMVTLTGYGLSSGVSAMFLIAAGFPVLCFSMDFAMKYYLATPFLYKAFLLDESSQGSEAITSLFVNYDQDGSFNLHELRNTDDMLVRRVEFRRAYVLKNIWLKVTIFALGSLGEVLLWIYSLLSVK